MPCQHKSTQHKSARQTASDYPFFKNIGIKPCRERFTLCNVQKIMPKRKPSHKSGHRRRDATRSGGASPAREQNPSHKMWLYGAHAVEAAMANPARRKYRLLTTDDDKIQLDEDGKAISETMARRDMDEILPPGAVHQGIALEVAPLAGMDIGDITEEAADDALVILLDQASDPRNIGAVMRSAAAFGASAIILPDRHAPEVTGVLAKAASGALEKLPLVRVTNVARTLAQLKDADFWCIGLDGDADAALSSAARAGRVALIIGSEGRGLRRLTAEKCDALASIPMLPGAGSLNLSAAAAIALYELRRTDNH